MTFVRYLVIISFIGLISSCKKNVPFTKDHLNFSKDTVLFDTVFTTIGSTTKRVKIYNRNNKKINIDAIQLMGGINSPFRLNVDGVSGGYHENIEIPADDSLFVFVEVTLAVNGQSYPLVISDSIRFRTNGLNQYVNLDVWGQDAYFHVNEPTEGTWNTDKPHVLYGTVACGFPGLDSNKCLTIPAGTQVYCHKNARLIVYKSCIDIQGNAGNPVVFQGDRLESFYDDVSGQWWGIRLIEANTSNISYAIIKNGSVGLQVDSTQSAITLNLDHTIITNHAFFALNVNAGSNIYGSSCLFGDAGLIGTYLFAGGEYHFNNCDFVNYWPGSRGGPSLLIKNYWELEGTTHCRSIINSVFANNVAYGPLEEEFIVDTLDCFVDMTFVRNYWKREEPYNYSGYGPGHIWTGHPGFHDVNERDFTLVSGSILVGAGDGAFAPATDIEGNGWGLSFEIGCYNFDN